MKERLIGLSLAILAVLTFAMYGHSEEASAPPSEEAKPAEAPAPPPGS